MATKDEPSASSARLAGAIGAAALLLLGFAFVLRIFWFGAEAPLPELLQSLPDSRSEADQEVFLARLRARFPSGAAESDLISELRRQGFKFAAQGRAASYDRQAGINDKCRRSGNLRWTTDLQGRLTEVAGGYYQHCP